MDKEPPTQCGNNPILSVIVPGFNPSPESLRRSLDSIQSSFQNIPHEIILIDDFSDDPIVVNNPTAYQDSGLYIIRHNKNLGPGISRNTGIEMAQGDWIAFLDCGDAFLGALPKNLLYELQDSINLIQFGFIHLTSNQQIPGPPTNKIKSFKTKLDEVYFLNSRWFSGTRIFRRNRISTHFPHLYFNEDSYFWLGELSKEKQAIFCTTLTYIYFYEKKSLTNTYYSDQVFILLNLYNLCGSKNSPVNNARFNFLLSAIERSVILNLNKTKLFTYKHRLDVLTNISTLGLKSSFRWRFLIVAVLGICGYGKFYSFVKNITRPAK